jgi:molybdenum cofactor biosynthesis enzyme MoaA
MCLGQNNYVDFKKILRSDYSNDYIKDKIKFALKVKPQRHDFVIDKNLKPYLKRYMNMTGG